MSLITGVACTKRKSLHDLLLLRLPLSVSSALYRTLFPSFCALVIEGDSCTLPWNLINQRAQALSVTYPKAEPQAAARLGGTVRLAGLFLEETLLPSMQVFPWTSFIFFSINDTNDTNGVLVYVSVIWLMFWCELSWWAPRFKNPCSSGPQWTQLGSVNSGY